MGQLLQARGIGRDLSHTRLCALASPLAMGGAATSQEKSALGGGTVFSQVRRPALGVRVYKESSPPWRTGMGETGGCVRHQNPATCEGES